MIITIIVLLILAGVSIALVLGDNGILSKATKSKQQTTIGDVRDTAEIIRGEYEVDNEGQNPTARYIIEKLIDQGKIISSQVEDYGDDTGIGIIMIEGERVNIIGRFESTNEDDDPPTNYIKVSEIIGQTNSTDNVIAEDDLGNIIVVPKDFKIVNPSTDSSVNYTNDIPSVPEGIVVEDSVGNQFVWIPVGEVKKSDNTTFVNKLGRYTFANDGTPTTPCQVIETIEQASAFSNDNRVTIETYYEELSESITEDQYIARNINVFLISALENHGFYIARFEASKTSDNKAGSTLNGTIWKDLRQYTAAQAARAMYSDDASVASDLVNSFAWDTAITFIQNCSTCSNYSKSYIGPSVNTANSNGTTDIYCNVYNLSSNYCEWSTEYSNYVVTQQGINYGTILKEVLRGGTSPDYIRNIGYGNTGTRAYAFNAALTGGNGWDLSFRVILYLVNRE